MWEIILLLGAVLFIAAISGVLFGRRGGGVPALPYKMRQSVFNRSEAAFFLELQKNLPQGYWIFPKMRIIDFIDPNSRDYSWRNKIWAKHVDFLICDQHLKPVLVVEVNGGSHFSQKRVDRDAFVRDIFSVSNLPLEVVQVGENFSQATSRVLAKLSNEQYGRQEQDRNQQVAQ